MLNYETAPAETAKAPSRWPADSRMQRIRGRPTMVLVAHPHCPCTRATMRELDRIMARVDGRVTVYVLFLKPADVSADWEKTDLWRSAAAIPGVTVIRDDGGIECARFHAQVSGQTMLYDADGRLLFSGGITASRGLSGDSAGRSAVLFLLTTGSTERTETPVFGCSLRDPNPQASQAGSSWKK